jgi:hypothetical protein
VTLQSILDPPRPTPSWCRFLARAVEFDLRAWKEQRFSAALALHRRAVIGHLKAEHRPPHGPQ